MKINKAIITAAGKSQRKLPIQTLIDRDGREKSVLEILIEEVESADIDEIAVIVYPGDEKTYGEVLGEKVGRIQFIPQNQPKGYAHALLCGSGFVGKDPFLHLVGDHLYVHKGKERCAEQLVKAASHEACSISAVQATRESIIPQYGVVGGQRIQGSSDLYKIDNVIEKPTPTIAELKLSVSGLRAGHYLCFFGMHVITPTIMDILSKKIKSDPKISLSEGLNELAKIEQYYALEKSDQRYDVGNRYGLFKAQLALALNGNDRDQVLTDLLELLASKEVDKIGR